MYKLGVGEGLDSSVVSGCGYGLRRILRSLFCLNGSAELRISQDHNALGESVPGHADVAIHNMHASCNGDLLDYPNSAEPGVLVI